jgi:hypothetical protein
MAEDRPRRRLARQSQQHVELGLHVGHALKLQFELAPVRPRQVFDFGQPALEILGAAASCASIGHARLPRAVAR